LAKITGGTPVSQGAQEQPAPSDFTSFSNVARKFVKQGGADALVLFNRFYQPDFNPANFATSSDLLLSTPVEMRLPLRWIAMLYGKFQADFAAR
jgi:dihydroorotate dehydrogenase (fumarate)